MRPPTKTAAALTMTVATPLACSRTQQGRGPRDLRAGATRLCIRPVATHAVKVMRGGAVMGAGGKQQKKGARGTDEEAEAAPRREVQEAGEFL